jgi:hypothetical protein
MSTTVWIGIAALVALVFAFALLAALDEERVRREWQTFVDANDCHVVEVKDAQSGTVTGPSFGFDGQMSVTTQTVRLPAQECWLCSNGVRYWKKAGMAIDRRRDLSS